MPAAGSVTFTVTVHAPLAGIVPLASRMPGAPAAMAPPLSLVSAPPQLLVVVVFASVIAPGAVGNVSVNPSPVTAVLFALVKVSVRLVVPPAGTNAAPKALAAAG